MADQKQFATIDEYIQSFPTEVQTVLEKVRQTIHEAAPDAVEIIKYNMPTFTLDGTLLIYFAAWKNHIALYHIPAGDEAFQEEVAPYANDKGSLLFPFSKPIPYELIKRVVQVRLQEW